MSERQPLIIPYDDAADSRSFQIKISSPNDDVSAGSINSPNNESSPWPYPLEFNEIGTITTPAHIPHKLGEFVSTAISGNDITSSVLYVSGVSAAACGIYAPIALAMVAVVLLLFRPIYTEVVTALPMNGGAYNILLNTTSKQIAGVAAALTILSYTATAVVSAQSAMSYMAELPIWSDPAKVIYYSTMIVLLFFALLNLIGISESAGFASMLFVFHLATLVVLIGASTYRMIALDFTLLRDNWNAYSPPPGSSISKAIFFGFASAMLGITGFETSANFVEEQAPGVFPKTLRNMWIAVAFFNPVISLLSFAILPLSDIMDPDNTGDLLAHMAEESLGPVFKIIVIVDAVLVLCGAVLTAYVGVTGLVRRLALDRVLFQFLLAENPMRRTNHWIIIGFFLIATSLYLIVGNNINTLGGVYTTAFLCVMALFAVGNMLLKYKRSRLPREVIAPWPVVLAAFCSVIAGLLGNIMKDSSVLIYFCIYFGATLLVIVIMFVRVSLLKIVLYFCKLMLKRSKRLHYMIESNIQKINKSKMIFFCKDDDIAVLNKAILYVRDNEQTNWIMIVHAYSVLEDIPPMLAEYVRLLDKAYPKIKIDLVLVKGNFGPVFVEKVAAQLGIPKNFCFITCPSERFTHKVADLGGVRMVTH